MIKEDVSVEGAKRVKGADGDRVVKDEAAMASASKKLGQIGAVAGLVILASSALVAALGERSWGRWEAIGFWLAGYGVAEALRRAGRQEGAAAALSAGLLCAVAALAWNSGGLGSINVELYPLVVLAGGVMGGARVGWSMAGLSAANSVGMWLAQRHGWLPEPTLWATPVGVAAQQVAIAFAMAVGIGAPLLDLRKARSEALAKRADAEEASAGFELMFAKSGAAMVVTATEPVAGVKGLRGLSANAAFEDLFGLCRGAALRDPGPHLDLWREREEVRRAGSLIRDEGGFEGLRVLMRRKDDGAPLSCQVSVKPIGWQGRAAYLWIFQDLTKSEELAEKLSERGLDLEQRAQAKADQIDLAKRGIAKQERLAQVGEMVAGVAHEMNSPIGNARLSAEALAGPAARLGELAAGATISRAELASLADKAAEACQMTLSNLERASEIIKSFQQLSTDQAGRARRAYGLSAVVDSALRLQAAALRARSVAWSVSCEGGAEQAQFEGYPGALSQIVTIMANNAMAHGFDWEDAPEGWGPRIEVSVALGSDGWALVEFRDNGKGMDEAVAAQVFDPFFTTKAGLGGSGLGLAIAKNLAADALGGELALARAGRGQGCLFELRIPPRPAGAIAPRDAGSVPLGHAAGMDEKGSRSVGF